MATHMLLLAAAAFAPQLQLKIAPCRPRGALLPTCCAPSTAYTFDDILNGVLADSHQAGSIDAALTPWMDRMDETFIPTLASKMEVAPEAEMPKLTELMTALQARSQVGYERGRDQLQALLGAGEINKMDAQLSALVRKNEVDAGLFYVIMRNMQDAKDAGDEGGERLLMHLYTRLQEELEKKTEPALALLHKLTRMDNPGVRVNLLNANLVEQTETLLPDGQKLQLQSPAPAKVPPMDLAAAIDNTIEKVLRLPIDRAAIEATAEDIRTVAKEARMVVAEHYDSEMLNSFTDALTPAFARALPAPRPEVEPGSAPRIMTEDD